MNNDVRGLQYSVPVEILNRYRNMISKVNRKILEDLEEH